MEAEETINIIKKLSASFQIREPNLLIDKKLTKLAYYQEDIRTIVLNPNVYCGAETAILHEFTHHLCLLVHRIDYPSRHGINFCNNLYQVALDYYNDVTKYNWQLEYSCIRDWARERGILIGGASVIAMLRRL